VTEPIFWLVCSLLLVAVCLTAVLMTAIPALRELARASRSAERLFDTLYRELPPTLESIRQTGSEISGLTDDLSDGVESAGNVVKQVDKGLQIAQRQVKEAGLVTQSVWTGIRVAWKTLTKPSKKRKHYHRPAAAQRIDSGHRPQGDSEALQAYPSSNIQRQPSADAHNRSSSPLQSSARSHPQTGAAHTIEQRIERDAEQSATELD
jgi:hypothetical protein